MSRRPRKSSAPPVVWVAWSENPGLFADLFRLSGDFWSPPHQVKLSRGQRHWTWSARFTTETGDRPMLITRTRRCADGDLEIVGSMVRFHWKISGADLRQALEASDAR